MIHNDAEIIRKKVDDLLAALPENTAEARRTLYNQLNALFVRRYPQHVLTLQAVIAELETAKPPVKEIVVATSPRAELPVIILSGVAACILAAGAAWYFTQQSSAIAEFDQGVVGYSSDPSKLEALVPSPIYEVIEESGDNIVRVNGSGVLVGTTPVEIDTSKTYRVSARLRVTKDDPVAKGSIMYIGAATYTADGVLETAAPGAHRYAAYSGVVSASQGWINIEGILTGTGNETNNQFRQATKLARPIAILNYRSNSVTEISSLHLEELDR